MEQNKVETQDQKVSTTIQLEVMEDGTVKALPFDIQYRYMGPAITALLQTANTLNIERSKVVQQEMATATEGVSSA